VVLPRLDSDLFDLLFEVATADLSAPSSGPLEAAFTSRPCVGVVLVSEGYPLRATPLKGLPLPQTSPADGVFAFWGGSTLSGDRVDASGGRVLTLCALGATQSEARDRAYAACSAYGNQLPAGAKLSCRSDIGLQRGHQASLTPESLSSKVKR
ncbi:MAG TPA: phosphoribosylglycinamide synthetase C domain-containing protein, partial [Candidatus Eremiobacteraceae bacterium]|nr:phosphoribosylglycinamide synthetase C domain-containing protein [Candidatus Eremiobacteraceae bacterium]